MWLISSIGFFSIVRKPGDDQLTVRSRTKGDLETLGRTYLSGLGPIVEGAGTDYRFRARVASDEFAAAAHRMVEDIDYPNFKDEVARRQGARRAHLYGEVWRVLSGLTQEDDE
jgi:hypothetical protein